MMLNSIGGWPLIGSNSNFDENQYNWEKSFAKIASYKKKILLSVTVDPDPMETAIYRIIVNLKLIILNILI